MTIKYRPDIDGLRAIAVLPVVLYHAGIPLFGGGFVGVDVFFVISGYLITGILLSDIEARQFSIARFYARRVRRIFPALLLVLAASAIAAWLVLIPDRLVDFGDSFLSVTAFVSNFHFWKAVNYFTNKAHTEPLLHTWSLAVEEQFYIFYPLLLWLLSRLRVRLLPVLVIVSVLSFAIAALLLARMPSAVFYLLPFRAWELLAGALVVPGIAPGPRGRLLPLAAGVIGALAILLPVTLYDAEMPFPGLAALPPVLGAALLIWGGRGAASPVHRLLSTAPFLIVGKASYSFYLWHFPLFAFAAYLLNRPLDPLTGSALSLVALLLALASLHFVETPVRRSRSRWSLIVPLAAMALAAIAGLALARSDGFAQRFPADTQQIIAAAGDQSRHPERCMSSGTRIVPPDQACRLGKPGAVPGVLLWGDSHSMVTATAMDAAARRAGQSFLYAGAADCPPGLGFRISPRFAPELSATPSYRYCGDYNAKMFAMAIGNPALKTVVISARWSNWRIGEPANAVENVYDLRLEDEKGPARSAADNARIFEAGFNRLIAGLIARGKTVYLVGPVPEPGVDVPQAQFVARFGLTPAPAPISLAQFEGRHRHALAILERSGEVGPVRYIWPHQKLCNPGACPLTRDGHPMFMDHNHLSVFAAQLTSPLYADVFAAR